MRLNWGWACASQVVNHDSGLCVQGLREQLDTERRVARSRQSGEKKEYEDKVSRLQVRFPLPYCYFCAAIQLVVHKLGCHVILLP